MNKTYVASTNGTIEIFIPMELKNHNDGQTRHFSTSNKERNAFIKTLNLLRIKSTPPEYRQRITVTRILGKGERLWDADSVLRGNAKQLIDSLVEAGFMHDDGPKWIEDAFGKQDDSKRDIGPAIKVVLEKVDERL